MFANVVAKLKKNSLKFIKEANDELGIYIPILGANDSKEKEQKNWFDVKTKIFEFIKSKRKVQLIFGDCGAGKSTFCRNFAKYLWNNYKPNKKQQLIPIFVSLLAIEKPSKDLIKEALKNMGLDEKERQLISDSKTKHQFIFIFDGYDEIHSVKNLYRDNKLYQWNAKVIISCRKEILVAKVGSYQDIFSPCKKNGELQPELLTELSVMNFAKEQQELYLQTFIKVKQKAKEPTWCKTKWRNYVTYEDYISKIASLEELIASPFLLKIVAEVLPSLVKEHKNLENLQLTRAKLYDKFVDRRYTWQANKLEVDLNKANQIVRVIKEQFGKKITSQTVLGILKNAFAIYSEEIAIAIFKYSKKDSINYAKKLISGIHDKNVWDKFFLGKDLKATKLLDLIRSGCFIRAAGADTYMFIHKSLQEYFASRKLFEFGTILHNAKLILKHDLNEKLFTQDKSTIMFLVDRVKTNKKLKDPLLQIVMQSRFNPKVAIAAANVITILNFANYPFTNLDLSGVCIRGANLDGAILDGAIFRAANLQDVILTNASINYTVFCNSNMKGVYFGQLPYIKHKESVKALCYSPDGKYLAATSGSQVFIYDKNRKLIKTIGSSFAIGTVSCLCFSYDSKVIAIGYENDIYVRATKNWKLIKKLTGHTDWVKALAFSSDNKYLASGSLDKTIRLWDAQKKFSFIKTLTGHTDWVKALAFSPDNKYLASGSDDKTIRLWDAQKKFSFIKTLTGHTGTVTALVFSSDNKYLASGSLDKTIRLWDAQKKFSFIKTLTGHTNWVKALVFSSDNKYLASGSWDDTIRLWDAQKKFSFIKTLTGHTNSVTALAFSSDNKYLTSGSWDCTIRLWDAQKKFSFIKTLTGHTNSVTALVFSSDNKYLASGSWDKTIRLWDAQKKFSFIKTLTGHTNWVTALVFSSDNKYLASGSRDNPIRLWDAQKKFSFIKTLTGHTDWVKALVFSADNKYLASGSWDNTIRLWDLKTMNSTLALNVGSRVNALIFSSNSKYLTIGCYDNSVRCYLFKAGKLALYWTSRPIFYSYKTNIDNVFGLSKDNELFLKQQGAIGYPSKKIITSKTNPGISNIIESYQDEKQHGEIRNTLGGKYILTNSNWVISMVRRKDGKHAFLIIEGLIEGIRQTIRADFGFEEEGQSKSGGKSSVNTVQFFKSFTPFNTKAILTIMYSKEFDHTVFKGEIDNYYYKTFEIDCEKVQKLLSVIEQDRIDTKKGNLVYNLRGNTFKLFRKAKQHNCTSWCLKKLKQIGHTITIKKNWKDFVVVDASKYLKDDSQDKTSSNLQAK